jgi:hypothetical protein
MARIVIPRLGRLAKVVDALFVPLMYLVSGTISEQPQRTHYWNIMKLTPSDVVKLDKSLMVCRDGSIAVSGRQWILFHIPILAGWRNYVVLQPEIAGEWRIGWITDDAQDVSLFSLLGPIRLLVGPAKTCFFGLDRDGQQIKVKEIGSGRIGQGGQFSGLPLL